MAIHVFSPRFLTPALLSCLLAAAAAQAQTPGQPDIAPPAIDKLVQAARSVVQLRTHMLPDATSAATLSDEREGTGMIIGLGGLVLTIGYLILEADKVELTDHDGKSVDATVVGYDHVTGFEMRCDGRAAHRAAGRGYPGNQSALHGPSRLPDQKTCDLTANAPLHAHAPCAACPA
jgi:hypothetical protein